MAEKTLKEFVVDKLEDMKARDIMVIDVGDKSSMMETLVICSGNSKRHIVSIANNLVVECKHNKNAPLSVEGKETGEWVLVDLGDVVAHIMQDATRDFYQLEKLWQE